jgi:hypothetical protein
MNRPLLVAMSGIMIMGLTSPAAASFCLEPRAPSGLFIRKPTKPYCAASRSCDEWEVSSYKAEVKRYYQQLEDYASSVDTFRKKAAEYVECMADLD